jgi:hypothetical protein
MIAARMLAAEWSPSTLSLSMKAGEATSASVEMGSVSGMANSVCSPFQSVRRDAVPAAPYGTASEVFDCPGTSQ